MYSPGGRRILWSEISRARVGGFPRETAFNLFWRIDSYGGSGSERGGRSLQSLVKHRSLLGAMLHFAVLSTREGVHFSVWASGASCPASVSREKVSKMKSRFRKTDADVFNVQSTQTCNLSLSSLESQEIYRWRKLRHKSVQQHTLPSFCFLVKMVFQGMTWAISGSYPVFLDVSLAYKRCTCY